MAGKRDLRQALLEAACEMFATQGYARTSTAAIVRRSRSSNGNLFHYFGNKDGLLRAAAAHELAERRAFVDPVLEGCVAGAERLGLFAFLNAASGIAALGRLQRYLTTVEDRTWLEAVMAAQAGYNAAVLGANVPHERLGEPALAGHAFAGAILGALNAMIATPALPRDGVACRRIAEMALRLAGLTLEEQRTARRAIDRYSRSSSWRARGERFRAG
jgi:AcrR family transcriptional regulator